MIDFNAMAESIDYAAAVGGFWIGPTGQAYPVRNECGHWDTARALGFFSGYHGGYVLGWVRITFVSPRWFTVSCTKSATPAALRTVVAIARKLRGTRQTANCEFEVDTEDSDDSRESHRYGTPGEDGDPSDTRNVDQFCRCVMRMVLHKVAAQKRAEEAERGITEQHAAARTALAETVSL